jgi:hypothetical protein
MLCVTLRSYSRACGGVTGGISDIATFDPNDLNFTQAAAIAGVQQPYTAVAARDGVDIDAATMFVINFQQDEAEWTFTQSVVGCAVKYEHGLIFQLPENSQTLTTFLQALDAASCCCGLGMIVRMNSGKVFVFGEKYVNNASIPRFTMKQDGTEGGSGKLFDEFNGANIHIKGSYSRLPYEFTGGWDVVEALMVVSTS